LIEASTLEENYFCAMLSKVLFTLLFLLTGYTAQAQYNFQPCYDYWELTDKLRKGINPKPEEWQKLRESDGYKKTNTADWDLFVRQVSLVYTPGNEKQIQQEMKTDTLLLPRIVRYAQEESRLKEYLGRIGQMHSMDSAIVYANRMLPKKWKNCFPVPKVDFILYNYDGSAREYGITIDLLVSYDIDSYRPGMFLGHEMVHYALWYCRVKLRHFKKVSKEHQAAFNAINGISEEGIADLIDKSFLLFDEQSPYMYRDVLLSLYSSRSIECIKKINHAFEQMADQPQEPYTSFSYWNSMVLAAGHIPGMYMGRVIQRNGFQDELVKHLENPFKFFYLYNQAAEKDRENPPVFSKKTVRFIRAMERSHY
jgi:hypothetical protein